MKLDKNTTVYNCCAHYIAVPKEFEGERIICPYCKKKLIAPVQIPRIVVAKK